MGFLSKLVSGASDLLFGESPKIKTRTMYQPEDFAQWMGAITGQMEPFLAKLLADYFGATAPMMGGTFGGQQGTFASQGVASQLPYLGNLAMSGMQGAKQTVVKPGSQGLVQSFLGGMGPSTIPFLGKMFGGGDMLSPGKGLNRPTFYSPFEPYGG